ncbi:MAG: hypothetical protein ACK4GH_09140, partial [Acinetobacter johnsonii]
STQVVLHNLLMIFLLIRHQQARSAILLSFKKKSTGFVNYFQTHSRPPDSTAWAKSLFLNKF